MATDREDVIAAVTWRHANGPALSAPDLIALDWLTQVVGIAPPAQPKTPEIGR